MKLSGYLVGICASLLSKVAFAQSELPYSTLPLNMPEGVTSVSRSVHGLHMGMFYLCVVLALGVYGVMAYSIYAHRKSRGAKAADFHESTTIEVIWTVIPFLILVVAAVPATRVLIAMEDTENPDMTIKVTGYQWRWHYDYLDQDLAFFSALHPDHNAARQRGASVEDVQALPHYLKEVDKPLVVPVGQKIRFLHTSNDVIHSWWVPDLSLKKDAIPGIVTTNWALIEEPGTYRGKCAELCGRDHGFMPVVVEALPQEEFDQWLAEQKGESTSAGGMAQANSGDSAAMENVAADSEDSAGEAAGAAAQPQSDATLPETSESEVAGSADTAPAAEAAGEIVEPVTAQPEPAASSGGEIPQDVMAMGEQVYGANCVACHQVDGSGMPPAFPAITGSDLVTGDDIAAHIDIVLNGKPGTAMMAFGALLSDEQLAAVMTYQRNALGNSTGDRVTPADVAALRN